ncbi:oligosaccharide flippase family protein [Parabacteroides sp. PF5-6]|uniref:oligosaccharide flippase family protein n=1 Tax=Parabacteroides sp. PF5-6 TaxID=1742403 RepID=UPI0024065D94|nr:oligosaccharide flippase family protein [Parabacteroides sp. PF5-6]MDF9831731.1 O-antigen/teichoic acid export membrane protein [Parabacteroides sp. PF5-6]
MNQLKAGAILSYLSIGLSNLIALLYTPFMLRMMGQSEYGLYSLVASIVSYLTILDFGFGNAIVRYTAKYRAEGKTTELYEMFGLFLLLYSGIGVIALGVGGVLYWNVEGLFGETMGNEELRKVRVMLLLTIFNIAITFPFSLFTSIITAYERFVFQKLINIIRIVLNALVMIAMLLLGYRAIGMVVVTVAFNVITLLINWWYCHYKLHIQIRFGRFKWDFVREVSIYSFWIFLNTIMDRIYWSTGQFILGVYKGAVSVAIYALAMQVVHIYINFSTAIQGVFLPRITSMVTRDNNPKAISDIFIRVGRIQYIVMVFILTGFIVFGRQFIRLWAGADYDVAYIIIVLLFVPLLIPLIQNLGISILQARNQMKFRSVCYVTLAVLSLALSIPLAQKYDGIGCAIGTAISLILGQVLIMNVYYWKKTQIDIPRFWREILSMSKTPLLIGSVSYFIVRFFPISDLGGLLIGIVLFSALYLPLFWFFDMNGYERNLLGEPFRKMFVKLRK